MTISFRTRRVGRAGAVEEVLLAPSRLLGGCGVSKVSDV